MASTIACTLVVISLTLTLFVHQSNGYVINSRDVYHTRNYEGCRREMDGLYGECMSNINTEGLVSDEDFAAAKKACDEAKEKDKAKCAHR